jgi:hypothetical protein
MSTPTNITDRNRAAYIAAIDAEIADLRARRFALLNPPFGKGDRVTRTDADQDDRATVWTVTGVRASDPRKVSLETADGRMAMNVPADTLSLAPHSLA